jgi:lipoprotein NlpD
MRTRPRTASMARGRARAALVLLTLLPLGCGGPRVSAPVEERPVRDEPLAGSRTGPAAGGREALPSELRQPGDWRPESYTVRKGDTLYSIALDHGLDYRELASWNELPDPNLIRIDQKLRLHAPPGWKAPPEPAPEVAAAEVAPAPAVPGPDVESKGLAPSPEIAAQVLPPPVIKNAPKALKLPYSEESLALLGGEPVKPAAVRSDASKVVAKPAQAAPVKPAAPAASPAKPRPEPAVVVAGPVSDSGWIWPTRGPVLHAFNQGSNPKGVAIGGDPGQAILAGAAGKVVYSGSGLRGYGKLIIIKHSDTYLSVYAHNRALLVKEGERVVRGQKIAEMGDSDSQRVALHFEIRRLGKPVDPLQYLPAGGAG